MPNVNLLENRQDIPKLIAEVLSLSDPEKQSVMLATASLREEIWLNNAERWLELMELDVRQGREDFKNGLRGLVRCPWWRLLPYGCWIEDHGAVVIFDREYCPIARFEFDAPPEVVNPLEWISWKDQRWFYEEATGPPCDPDTLPQILMIERICGLREEVHYRMELSNYGHIPHKIWGQDWKSG